MPHFWRGRPINFKSGIEGRIVEGMGVGMMAMIGQDWNSSKLMNHTQIIKPFAEGEFSNRRRRRMGGTMVWMEEGKTIV